jgi:lysyl-tRNA synthetase class 2
MSKEGKSKDTKIAVVVVNKSANLEQWEYLNTISHLNASFAARLGKQLILQDKINTKDNHSINLNIQHAIVIREANSNKKIQELISKAKSLNLTVAEFTREMLITTNDKQIIEITGGKKLEEVEYLGVLIFGKKLTVESLTNQFGLFKDLSLEKSKGGK